MLWLDALAMFAAAFVGGVMNSIAGGGTLVTFPVLLWVGLDPKVANATSIVALWPGALSSAWGYRRELAGIRKLLLRLCLPSFLGSAVGVWLLLLTPSATFADLVPYLILFATALFTLQEPISRRLRTQTDTGDASAGWWFGAIIFQFGVAIYGGYFGAGIGILMLAALGLLGVSDIHRANGVKNLLGMFINGLAMGGFMLSGLVSWPHALLMAAAAIAGGYGGAGFARRIGRPLVRKIVVAIGLVIGIIMLFKQGSGS